MPNVILKGSQQCQWQIGGHSLPGGIPVELTDEELKNHKDVVLEVIKDKKVKEEKNKEDLDINDDGVVDDKDSTLAGKVLQAKKPRKVKK